MEITVRFFASYREMFGQDPVTLALPEGSTVAAALERLAERYPDLSRQTYAPLTACNLEHVEAGHVLMPGDDLAVFPPVSGG